MFFNNTKSFITIVHYIGNFPLGTELKTYHHSNSKRKNEEDGNVFFCTN